MLALLRAIVDFIDVRKVKELDWEYIREGWQEAIHNGDTAKLYHAALGEGMGIFALLICFTCSFFIIPVLFLLFIASVFIGTLSVFLNHPLLYLTMEAICWLVAKILFGFKVTGRDNIPKNSNFIIIARHRSFWDIPLMALSLGFKYQITFIGRRSLWALRFNPLVRPWVVFVNREQPSFSEVKQIMAALNKGEIVGMFPEGTRDPEAVPSTGIVRFSQNTEKPILPLNIKAEGPYGRCKDRPDGNWFAYITRRINIELRIGKPFWIPQTVSKHDFVSLTEDILEDLDHI